MANCSGGLTLATDDCPIIELVFWLLILNPALNRFSVGLYHLCCQESIKIEDRRNNNCRI